MLVDNGALAASRKFVPWPGIERRLGKLGMLFGIACLSWAVQASAERPLPRLLMGTRSSNHTATLVYNPHPMPGFTRTDISLHIIIPTVGRRSIFVLLKSLAPQLEMQDHVTVVFDAKDLDNVLDDVNAELARLPGTHRTVMEAENSNDWGASIKSKHQLKDISHFVMFADDDNYYEPDALQVVRKTVQHDLDGLYVFQMRYAEAPDRLIPDLSRNGEVEVNNVDTGCGVVPTRHAHLSEWMKGSYGADGYFYSALSERLPRTYLVPYVIYVYVYGS